jgi:hypothetical protein
MAKRVYFAFHYQDVIDFRANVVRNHNAIDGANKAGYYDSSIWEKSKKTGDTALKRLINGELDGSSVTAVLIGADTYARRWVRYEILKSIERGNSLLGIHINGIAGKDRATKSNGPNPFDYLGLRLNDEGTKVRPTEWKNGKFVWYDDLEPFDRPSPAAMKPGVHCQLSTWFRVHDWISDDGYDNFGRWLE